MCGSVYGIKCVCYIVLDLQIELKCILEFDKTAQSISIALQCIFTHWRSYWATPPPKKRNDKNTTQLCCVLRMITIERFVIKKTNNNKVPIFYSTLLYKANILKRIWISAINLFLNTKQRDIPITYKVVYMIQHNLLRLYKPLKCILSTRTKSHTHTCFRHILQRTFTPSLHTITAFCTWHLWLMMHSLLR